ncbi:serine hydrolase domain-containing protein [Pontibacter akesuensis]|uniref:CubicO group peptidase, beta-lactamase class C family n=1 Tax=Pontibacter akesuensis TaxID=388950 RepID=A0A1I7GPA9_9BACT|nr:serine hydrolase domain-containing protein [Pontibacter akesuensis]GHA55723.1 serine hydrolase [Pontibacter akesuensis]SFU50239.1 CubicO group peptidase, beta-lactamase class C family [Pontibacter akesuensis]
MPELQEKLDALLARHYAATTPGAVLLLTKEDKVTYQGHCGLADVVSKAAITADTTFRLASVSKQFTAMCLHLLAQQQRINLQDELGFHFPELAHLGSVRLWHLLCHTSGLPDFEEHIPAQQTAQLTDEEVLEITAAQPSLLFPAGTQFRYSNTGYVLLGLLVERITSMGYDDFLQEHIFRPLHMHRSTLYRANTTIPNRAMGYAADGAGSFILADQSLGSATRGDGCIYTSATDYLKWHRALTQLPLFNITNQLNTYYTQIDSVDAWRYGMGWFQERLFTGQHLLLHSGDTCGFTNLVIRQQEPDLLFACFSNIANNQPFLQELLQVLAEFSDFLPPSDLVWQLPWLTR